MSPPKLQGEGDAITLNKTLAWTILWCGVLFSLTLIGAGLWVGTKVGTIESRMVTVEDSAMRSSARFELLDSRLRPLEAQAQVLSVELRGLTNSIESNFGDLRRRLERIETKGSAE